MDCYVFRTQEGEIGYFQKNSKEGNLYVNRKPSPVYSNIETKLSEIDLIMNSVGDNYEIEDELLSKKILFNISQSVGHDISLYEVLTGEGEYYSRIAGDNCGLYKSLTKSDSFTDEMRAYYNIVDMLNDLFKIIEPTQKNLRSYGHKIREILILACTEVEYLLLQFLKDNDYKDKRVYSTIDYVKALKPLKIDEYRINLKMHPSLDTLTPFFGWSENKPTQSLTWYDAYNAVKHDRGGNFENASLEAVINAVGAIHILLEAQYGKEIFHKFHLDFKSCFQTEEYPIWNMSDLQVPIINCNWSSGELVWNKPIKYFKEGA